MAKTDKTPQIKDTNLYALFGTDNDLEEAGAWVPVSRGVKIKVRRLKSVAAQREFDAAVAEKFGEGYVVNVAEMSADEIIDWWVMRLAEGVLIDWKGVQSGGEEIPFSKAIAYEMLTKARDFREFVQQIAEERDAFRDGADEEAEKN